MIGPVQATQMYTAMPSVARDDETPAQAASPQADRVSISPAGQTSAASLRSLPDEFLNPDWHKANAQKDMQALLQQLGIPSSTRFDIESHNDGTFTVTSTNAEAAARIEQMLNDGSAMALRNDLIGMENSLKIQQIAKATEQAQKQADADPAMTELLYGRLPGIAAQISAQVFTSSFVNDQLDYTLA